MWTQLQSFVGKSLRNIEKVDWSWFFRFDAPLVIVTEAQWRLITPQGIAVADGDHKQQFRHARTCGRLKVRAFFPAVT
jgi:hypothetical protein